MRTHVYLRAAGARDELPRVCGADAGAGENFDPPCGMAHHGSDRVCALRGCGALAARQHTGDPGGDQGIERRAPVGDNVDGAAEDAFFAVPGGKTGKLACAFGIDRAVFMQEAEHEPVCAVFQQKPRVLLHNGVFRFRVAKAALARAHHRHDLQRRRGFFHREQAPERGCQAAVKEVTVQFDPFCARAAGEDRILRAAAAYFKQYPHGSVSFLLMRI